MVWRAQPRSILDVGPGWGKAGVLLREYVGVPPIERVDAVELWRPYVTLRLRALYDDVFICDVRDLSDEQLGSYDLVLMADVLEHLGKLEGLALLERIPGHVVVCTPREFFQNPEAGEIPPEEHRSLWTREDFGDRVDIFDEHALEQWGALALRLGRKP
jgi:hypothetical protein